MPETKIDYTYRYGQRHVHADRGARVEHSHADGEQPHGYYGHDDDEVQAWLDTKFTKIVNYDPTTDPARLDEATVRGIVGIGRPLPGLAESTILLQGRFRPGGRGCYASVEVLALIADPGRGDAPYSTHTAIVRAEADGAQVRGSERGHYDMTREQAEQDLAER